MRGTKAKLLRKMAYGDISLKATRLYETLTTKFIIKDKINEATGKLWEILRVTFFNAPISPRAIYQRLKREYRKLPAPLSV